MTILLAMLALAGQSAADPYRSEQPRNFSGQYPALRTAPARAGSPDDLAVEALHNFAACVVAKTPDGARQVLRLDPRSPQYRRKAWTLATGHDRCVLGGWRIGFQPTLFAGALAEAALASDVRPHEMIQRLAYSPARPAIVARGPLEDMALCTVFKATGATARLLATEPASADELNAIGALQPVLGQCLKSGAQAHLNRPALRALLALAAWRIAETPGSAS